MYRSCVRSEIGRRDLGGREGVGGHFEGAEGAKPKARSARATDRSVVGEDAYGGARVESGESREREASGGGRGDRSRVREERHEG